VASAGSTPALWGHREPSVLHSHAFGIALTPPGLVSVLHSRTVGMRLTKASVLHSQTLRYYTHAPSRAKAYRIRVCIHFVLGKSFNVNPSIKSTSHTRAHARSTGPATKVGRVYAPASFNRASAIALDGRQVSPFTVP